MIFLLAQNKICRSESPGRHLQGHKNSFVNTEKTTKSKENSNIDDRNLKWEYRNVGGGGLE